MARILVILNPCAGKKRGAKALSAILDVFCRAGFDPLVRTTQGAGDAIRLARDYADEMDRIACIGGDGSFNEVVSGVLQSGADTPIGYIPAGSTNDFARSLGLPKDLIEAAKTVVTGAPAAFDVGRFGDRYFTYVASFGAFTKASYATSQRAKNTIGHPAYLLRAAALLPSIRSLPVSMQTGDGERFTGDYLFGAIGNSTSMGGVLTLEKSLVDFQDGKFELLLVKKPGSAKELAACVRGLLRHDYTAPLLELRQIRSLTVEADPSMDWTLDGEQKKGSSRIDFEVLPGAVRLITGMVSL